MLNFLNKEHTIAPLTFNRWRIVISAIMIHLSIGSVYAWSVFNTPLSQLLGVVGWASEDWGLSSVVQTFSICVVFASLTMAIMSKYIGDAGPRKMGFFATLFFSGGFFISAIGIATHQIWLIFLGYGAITGIGIGLAYVSPVATLVSWFPDRKGLATGLAIMGFGGGAFIASELQNVLLSMFSIVPNILSPDTVLQKINGITYAMIDGVQTEVLVKQANIYVVGTGNTGAFSTFLIMGSMYFVSMMTATFMMRVPQQGWKPKGWIPKTTSRNKHAIEGSVSTQNAMKMPQFYFIVAILILNTSAGMGVISVASTMITDIFSGAFPLIVTGAFATFYVSMISIFNTLGRIGWASASDYLGRKNTLTLFFVLGPILYLLVAYSASAVGQNASVIYLVMFYGATMLAFTIFGGGFAVVAAFVADIFGQKNMGAIHSRVMLGWAVSALLGPIIITQLRYHSWKSAVLDLVATIDNVKFESVFGLGKDKLDILIENKTITIEALMKIAPVGTADPTPTLYNTTMYAMAGVLLLGLVMISLVKPVDKKYIDK